MGDNLDDQTLLRWLRAENNSVEKAEKRLRKHAVWREETFPQGRVLEVRFCSFHCHFFNDILDVLSDSSTK